MIDPLLIKIGENNPGTTHKIGGTIGSLSSSLSSSSVTPSTLIRSEGQGNGPPNINLANIPNLPGKNFRMRNIEVHKNIYFFLLGLNVSLQSLTSNVPGMQNVQVSFPGFTIPISISSSSGGNGTILVTSPSPSNVSNPLKLVFN